MSNIPFSRGTRGMITYSILHEYGDETTYLVECNQELLNLAVADFFSFVLEKVPKFGKYEVEEFVAEMLLISLVKGDMTELMNAYISYDDAPYNSGKYYKDTIIKRILEFCKVISKENGIIKLKYLGEPNT